MSKGEFGKIIASLRKEFKNEFDEPMTQENLAELAKMPLITLQKIEQGRQANLKPDMVLNLANSLKVPFYSRNNFFLASLGIDGKEIVEDELSQRFIEQIQTILSQLQAPAFVSNSFGDLLLVHPAFFELLDIDFQVLQASQASHKLNLYRIIFSPEFAGLRQMMGDSYASFAQQQVLILKSMTLKYRSRNDYQELIPELNLFSEFRRYWQSPAFFDKDIYILSNTLEINHPRWGLLAFISFPVQVLAEQSDLFLFTYQPLDNRTAKACAKIIRETGTQTVKMRD